MKTSLTILALAFALAATGQTMDKGKKAPRAMNYHPDQGQIVCVNGNNEYIGQFKRSLSKFNLGMPRDAMTTCA